MPTPKQRGGKIYEVTNRNTGEKRISVATNAQDACTHLGWQIGDCYVYETKPTRPKGSPITTGLLVHIPCRVCFYQYAECRLPTGQQCPCKPTSPELKEWVKQALEAHKCIHVGQSLRHKDYELQQKWLPLSQAVEELTPTP